MMDAWGIWNGSSVSYAISGSCDGLWHLYKFYLGERKALA